MSETPWLTIVGLVEDGPEGLSPASLEALAQADIIMGASRHLNLLPDLTGSKITWPVPFADGLPILLSHRGSQVVMLASGNPFWFGGGSVITRYLKPKEWRALPAPSAMSLAAAALGWPLERTQCFGLHANPFAQLRPHLFPTSQILATMRDGAAVADLATWLAAKGFGATQIHVMEALGGLRQRIRKVSAECFNLSDVAHPVCVGLEIVGTGSIVPLASGRPDNLFQNDGQITKRPIRALTLSALAPCPGEHLWDIGGGSGSIAIEWLMAHPTCIATTIEIKPERAAQICENAAQFGVERLQVVIGSAPTVLEGLDVPNAVFIGGGISHELLKTVWNALPSDARLVANAVTLESEALLSQWHHSKGGELLRIELANAQPLGRKRGWSSTFPIVQWSVSK